MVATDVASRGIGMIATPLTHPLQTPSSSISHCVICKGALLDTSRALASVILHDIVQGFLCFSKLITRDPWTYRRSLFAAFCF